MTKGTRPRRETGRRGIFLLSPARTRLSRESRKVRYWVTKD